MLALFTPTSPISKREEYTVKNTESKLLDYSDLRFTQSLLVDDASLVILTHSFLTQPSTSLYPSRDLKNHSFKLSVFSSTQLLSFNRFCSASFSHHTHFSGNDIYACLFVVFYSLFFGLI